MRATGIVRRIDDLGRIVIPKAVRQELHLREGGALDAGGGGRRLKSHDTKAILINVSFFLICLFILSADWWVELVIKLLHW